MIKSFGSIDSRRLVCSGRVSRRNFRSTTGGLRRYFRALRAPNFAIVFVGPSFCHYGITYHSAYGSSTSGSLKHWLLSAVSQDDGYSPTLSLYIYLSIHLSIYLSISLFIHIYIYIYIYICTFKYLYMHTNTCGYTSLYMYMCT